LRHGLMVEILSRETGELWLQQWRRGLRAPQEPRIRFRIYSRPDDTDTSNRILENQRTSHLLERSPLYDGNARPHSRSGGIQERRGRSEASWDLRSNTDDGSGSDSFPSGSFAHDVFWSKQGFGRLRSDWLQPSQPRGPLRGLSFPPDSVPRRINVAWGQPAPTTSSVSGIQPTAGQPWEQPSSVNWRQNPNDVSAVGSSGPSTTVLGRKSVPRFGAPPIDQDRARRLIRSDVFGDSGSAEASSLQ
jgi:hypothetical protein